jgi:NTP pyrophosphatase (non-canonical NTP hydrolase)
VNFEEYQKEVQRTMNFTGTEAEIVSNMCMGLAGEAGELVDYVKKVLYHGHEFDRNKIISEAGDVLWYLTALLNKGGINLAEVVDYNKVKLRKRYPDGFDKQRSINREEPQQVRGCETSNYPKAELICLIGYTNGILKVQKAIDLINPQPTAHSGRGGRMNENKML